MTDRHRHTPSLNNIDIEKICEHHGWTNLTTRSIPTPMRSDSKYLSEIELTKGPGIINIKEHRKLEQKMGFNYRQAIGELIYAHTICRIDISVPIIMLSQHSSNPAQIHYEAVKNIYAYLYAKRERGLTYWRPEPRYDLPTQPDPTPISSNNQLEKLRKKS